METTIKLGRATLRIDFVNGLRDSWDEEVPGAETNWTFSTADARLADGLNLITHNRDGDRTFKSPIAPIPEDAESGDEFYLANDGASVASSNTDHVIALLATFAQHERTFTVKVEAANPYWPFHDLQHADTDAVICDDGDVELNVGSEDEERALVCGALHALKAGVPLALIVTELVKVAPEFRSRWSYDTDALATFLDRLDVKVAPLIE